MTSISLAEYRELFPVKTKKRRSAKQGTRKPSEGETVLATHLRACKINFEQEYKFHPKRKWRADFFNYGNKDFGRGGRRDLERRTSYKGQRLYRGYGEI